MGYRAVGSDFASKLKTKRTARIGIAVLVFGMLAVFAEFERDILRDRVKAGIAQARKEGKLVSACSAAART